MPMLEDQIGVFICDQMFKNGVRFEDLNFDKIKDDDHVDLSKVSSIFLKIVSIGIEFDEDMPDNGLYLY